MDEINREDHLQETLKDLDADNVFKDVTIVCDDGKVLKAHRIILSLMIRFRSFMIRLYNRLRFPIVPLYGGFPVKLRTIIGTPIPYDKEDTPFTLKEKCKSAIEKLIKEHQRVPGSIFCALADRLRIRSTTCKSKQKDEKLQYSQKNSIDIKLVQPLLKTHSS